MILLNLYRHLFFFFNDGILKIPGNKLITRGYKSEVIKLIIVSLIKCN